MTYYYPLEQGSTYFIKSSDSTTTKVIDVAPDDNSISAFPRNNGINQKWTLDFWEPTLGLATFRSFNNLYLGFEASDQKRPIPTPGASLACNMSEVQCNIHAVTYYDARIYFPAPDQHYYYAERTVSPLKGKPNEPGTVIALNDLDESKPTQLWKFEKA